MKVAMVTGSYPPQPCGVGDYTQRLVQELMASGIQVDVITTRAETGRTAGEVQYELPNWKLSTLRDAARWMSSRQYDVIHIQYPAKFYGYLPDLAFLTSTIRRYTAGPPIVVTLHEFRITHFLRKITAAVIAQFSDAVVLTAESERRSFERFLWWMKSKLHLIRLAVVIPTLPMTSDEKKMLRRKYSFGDEDIVIVYFGFLHPNKGIERLLESFALVHRSQPTAKLMMICLFDPQTHKYHAAVRGLVERLGIEQQISWTGFLPPDDVSRHLSIADIGLLPFEDGVSFRRLSFMTLLNHGVPTVTTVGKTGLGELSLSEGESLVTVPAQGSAEQLARRVAELIFSVQLRDRLRTGGVEWARPYRWDAAVQQTINLYRTLLVR